MCEHVEPAAIPDPPSPTPPSGISRRARTALPIDIMGTGMVVRPVSVRPSEVVFVKGLVEASDGLCAVFAERGGELLLVAPRGREAELSELLADLERDVGARVGAATDPPAPAAGPPAPRTATVGSAPPASGGSAPGADGQGR
jgi:hypothetical protein